MRARPQLLRFPPLTKTPLWKPLICMISHLLHAHLGKEFPSRTLWKVHAETAPLEALHCGLCSTQNRAFFEEDKGGEKVQRGRVFGQQRGQKEKRTHENRSDRVTTAYCNDRDMTSQKVNNHRLRCMRFCVPLWLSQTTREGSGCPKFLAERVWALSGKEFERKWRPATRPRLREQFRTLLDFLLGDRHGLLSFSGCRFMCLYWTILWRTPKTQCTSNYANCLSGFVHSTCTTSLECTLLKDAVVQPLLMWPQSGPFLYQRVPH